MSSAFVRPSKARISLLSIIGLIALLLMVSAAASAQTVSASGLGGEVTSDFKYIVNNTLLDAEDVATSPLYVALSNSPLFSPRFYLVLAGAGALWGGSFALDQTLRSQLRSMSSNDANLLQDVSYASVSASAALLYGWGLYANDARARQDAITAGMGAGIASLLD